MDGYVVCSQTDKRYSPTPYHRAAALYPPNSIRAFKG